MYRRPPLRRSGALKNLNNLKYRVIIMYVLMVAGHVRDISDELALAYSLSVRMDKRCQMSLLCHGPEYDGKPMEWGENPGHTRS